MTPAVLALPLASSLMAVTILMISVQMVATTDKGDTTT
jgi:hypothetical protein